jgi:membrane protein insertase Oxa1/YidC/SpoIIIJ
MVRVFLFPVTFNQLASTQKTTALSPKITEIKEKYPNDKDLQARLTGLLYEEAKVMK